MSKTLKAYFNLAKKYAIREKIKLAYLLCGLLMTLCFSYNILHTVDMKGFLSFQLLSENLVTGKAIADNSLNVFDNGGFLCDYQVGADFEEDKQLYMENHIPADDHIFATYTRQIGLQGMFFSFVNKLPLPKPIIYYLVQLLYSAILSAVLLRLLAFLIEGFKYYKTAILCFSLSTIFFCPTLLNMAKNLYWVPFTFFLPMLACFYAAVKFKNEPFKFKSLALISLAVFIKSACGYEYISTILISAIIPVVYYAVMNKYKLKSTALQFIRVSVAAVSGFVLAVAIHTLQKLAVLGSLSESIKDLADNASGRTFNPESLSDSARLNKNMMGVLIPYFAYPVLIIAIVIIAVVIGIKLKRKKWGNPMAALAISLGLAFLAPMSWYVLAKGHAMVHTAFNTVLWSVPFSIFAFVFLFYAITQSFSIKPAYQITAFSLFLLLAAGVNNLLYTGDYTKKALMLVPVYKIQSIVKPISYEMPFVTTWNDQGVSYISTDGSRRIYAMLMLANGEISINGQKFHFDFVQSEKAEKSIVIALKEELLEYPQSVIINIP
ncbi:MAG: hypothetical protein LBS74_08980 [Oscillospiraceae bacterium]|nr:hypothetical protein [Oscillospiraceae bacterium]